MAGSRSKNARGSMPGSKGPTIDAAVRLIMPLNYGRHARVLDVTSGRNVHAATDSAAFDDAVAGSVAGGFGPRILAELDALALAYPDQPWAAARVRIDERLAATAA